MKIIGITGTLGAGKGTVVEHLKTKGYKHYSARNFIVKEVEKRGLEPIRDNITLVGNDLRQKNFPGYIIQELLEEAQADGSDSIIEAIRAVGEVNILRERADDLCIIGVDADINRRYERISKRGTSTDNVTFEKFVEDENKELNKLEPWEMNIKICMAEADYVISNDGTKEELAEKVDAILSEIA